MSEVNHELESQEPELAQSPFHGEMFKALAAFQAEMPSAQKSGMNPHFRSSYATLQDIMEVVKVAARHGLSITQVISRNTLFGLYVRTMLCHTSGAVIESCIPLVLASDRNIQAMGSAITYARRYGIQAVLGIAAEEDDDGNSAKAQPAASRQRAPRQDPYASQHKAMQQDPSWPGRQPPSAAFGGNEPDPTAMGKSWVDVPDDGEDQAPWPEEAPAQETKATPKKVAMIPKEQAVRRAIGLCKLAATRAMIDPEEMAHKLFAKDGKLTNQQGIAMDWESWVKDSSERWLNETVLPALAKFIRTHPEATP